MRTYIRLLVTKKIPKYSGVKILKFISLSQVDVGRKTRIAKLLCSTRLSKYSVLLSCCSGLMILNMKGKVGGGEKEISFKDTTQKMHTSPPLTSYWKLMGK